MNTNPTTTEIIESLRSSGHSVECPVTGRVRLNGVDVTTALRATQHAPGSDDEDWTLPKAVEYMLWVSGEES